VRARREAHDLDERPLLSLKGDVRRARDGQFEDERSRVVGDAAHNVEPSRRTRDRNLRLWIKELTGALIQRADKLRHIAQTMHVAVNDLISAAHQSNAEPALLQGLMQQRFNLRANRVVGVTGPGNIGLDLKWSAQRITANISDDDASLARD